MTKKIEARQILSNPLELQYLFDLVDELLAREGLNQDMLDPKVHRLEHIILLQKTRDHHDLEALKLHRIAKGLREFDAEFSWEHVIEDQQIKALVLEFLRRLESVVGNYNAVPFAHGI